MNKTKDKQLSRVITSFPVFELRQIRIESKDYPRRKIGLQRVGLYDSKEHAEEAMLDYIALEKRNYSKWEDRDYHDDCLGYFLEEVLVHNVFATFYINERPQKCYSFTADGVLNDYVALDEFRWYSGRKTEAIRFKVGDVVEVVDGGIAELAIVGGLPMTEEYYRRLEEDPDECEHPSHFLDESDDCYLVYTLGEVGSHFHPVCYKVFRPTHPVPEKVVAQLRANLEEMKNCTAF